MSIDNILELELKDGTVIIEMFPELAPKHVAQIKNIVRQKFYDGKLFHRVIEGFMVQTGCPKGDGTGAITMMLDAEFNNQSHDRGICSMARSAEVNSASCQFFIVLVDNPQLDGQYTVWGKVVSGMEFVDNIKKGDVADNGKVEDPDKIISMKVRSDKEIKIM